jgi:hypothetical protein
MTNSFKSASPGLALWDVRVRARMAGKGPVRSENPALESRLDAMGRRRLHGRKN